MFETGQMNLAQGHLPPFGDELGYYINASFVYALIPFVPRLDLEFAQGAVPKGLAGAYDYSKGFTPYRAAFDPSFNQKDWAFTLRPSLTLYLGAGTFVEIGDYLSFVDLPTAAILMGKPEVEKGIMNAVYVDFKWSF
jgi:hypothetical protein